MNVAKSMMSIGCLFSLCLSIVIITYSSAQAIVTETLKLTPNDPQAGSFFGQKVAISGGWAVVSAPNNDFGNGAAYVFDSSTGTQLFKLVPDDLMAGDRFGNGALIISDSLAYIGGARDTSGTAAIWVFDLITGDQVAKWTPEDPDASTTWGADIAIMGNVALVGAPSTDVSGFENAGAGYLLDLTTGDQIAKLVADVPQTSGHFGDSVAVDSGIAAVYASGSNIHTVYLFDPATGSPIADFAGPSISNAGNSMALNGDKLLLGVANTFPGDDGVRLYDISDPLNVTFTTIPWPQAGPGQFFGKSVALSDDAMLVSTWFSDDIVASGIVHLFDPDTGALLESFRPSDAVVDDAFGQSIGLDGQTLIVGAPGEPTTFGAAYLFTIPEPASLTALILLGPGVLLRRRGVR